MVTGLCYVYNRFSSQLLSARSIHTTAFLDDLDLLQLFRASDLESLDEFDYAPSQYETIRNPGPAPPSQGSIPHYTPAPTQPMAQLNKPVLSPIKHVCAVLHNPGYFVRYSNASNHIYVDYSYKDGSIATFTHSGSIAKALSVNVIVLVQRLQVHPQGILIHLLGVVYHFLLRANFHDTITVIHIMVMVS